MHQSDTHEGIATLLDRLAAQVLAGSLSGPEILKSLSAIEETARAGGKKSAADAAAGLLRQACAGPSAQIEDTIAGGLDALRRAVENSAGESSAAPLALAQDPELIRDFIQESREHLASIEAQALLLERDPESSDPLHAAFRGFHTIKGLAGFLDLGDIREVAHEVETLLDRARNRELAVTPEVIDVVLAGADYLSRGVAWVEAGLDGTAGPAPEFNHVLVRVQGLLSTEPGPAPAANPAPLDQPETVNLELARREPAASALLAPGAAAPGTAALAAASPRAIESAGQGAGELLSVRVEAAKLDHMMDMVGELVIAQSLIAHAPELEALEGSGLQRSLQQFRRITGEVQRMAMSLRMLPVAQLFQRMNRLVRDLARKTGKQVRLELSGEDTELDKSIIEQMADPLMHMVRNSLDHGIELPEERAASGKPAEGVLSLSAAHQAGHIVIEISDDGRGLNAERILKKARQRGLIAEGHAPSESEIFYLIFEPGFSTAEQVTDVSGRGVGMDVVRRHVQGLRGHIDIRSTPGRGTTFQLKLPLTLAIIEGLIVKVGAERYVLPIASVREMLRPSPDALFTIEGRGEMAMIRGSLLPILRLDRRFAVPGAVQNPSEGLLVVAENEGRRFCLLVDAMLGKQEVVIKSLGETFRDISGISGGAIMGDGRVGLILDLNGIVRENAGV